jgi:hypothetical protein
MKLVNDHHAVKARLVRPNDNGYLMLAAEIGTWRGPFLPPSRIRTALLRKARHNTAKLRANPDVLEVTVFCGSLRPPGEGSEVLEERGRRNARYDVVVLTRTTNIATAIHISDNAVYTDLVEAVRAVSRATHHIAARNVARLGDVDHGPNHPYLFNYFYADDDDTLLKVWEYTAGWFQAKTALPNSTLMRPLPDEPQTYGIINHASWPTLRAFLPSLVLRPTFRSFVLANFEANGIAAQPIIYRREAP